jgi:hypothetical protein
MDEAAALSSPVVEDAGMADAGAMAKNDAKIAGARYFIIFMLLPDVVSMVIPMRESTRKVSGSQHKAVTLVPPRKMEERPHVCSGRSGVPIHRMWGKAAACRACVRFFDFD